MITSSGPLTWSSPRAGSSRVVDEPDRYGFAYGTLPSHPEEGEEHFLVTRAASGTVRFDVVAFSRPHDLLTKLGGPLPPRLQARATRRYLAGMRDFVTPT